MPENCLGKAALLGKVLIVGRYFRVSVPGADAWGGETIVNYSSSVGLTI